METIREPEKISNSHHYGITPFGVYCLECCSPVGNVNDFSRLKDSIRMHNKREKHMFRNGDTASSIANSLKDSIGVRYGHIREYSPWIRKKNMKSFICTCGELFSKHSNIERHIKMAEKKNPEKIHQAKPCLSVSTVCGRVIDEESLKAMMKEPIIEAAPLLLPGKNDCSIANEYIPIQSNNNKWLTVSLTKVKNIFAAYKCPNESIDAYLSSLKLLTIHENSPVIERILESLNLVNDNDCNQSSNDSTLNFFLDCCKKWIKDYCREHVNMLDGRSRFRLQSYFDETILVNSGYNLNFNMREKEDVIIKETLIIVELSWKLHEKGLYNKRITERIQTIKNDIIEIEQHFGGESSDSAMGQMISRLVIQQYLHSILIETMDNAYHLLMGHHIVILRLFKVKKCTVDGREDNILSMRSCGEFGSIVSLHIHIYRLASASLMACTESSCWNGILNRMKESYLCHILSPIINQVKRMNNEKIDVRVKTLKANGDISIDDFTFERCKWSTMIKSIIKRFDGIMPMIFANNIWKQFVDNRKSIQVKRIANAQEVSIDDVYHYNFWLNSNGRIIRERDLTFKKEIATETFEKMTGLVMICLHGLGLGSTRISELLRIQKHQVEFKGGSFYYISISNKRRSAEISNKKVVTHKLPPSISRYLLLYDFIGREYSKGRDCFLFGGGSNAKISTEYENKEFYSEFASIFELTANCSCLVMRHLYTSICNFVFPGNNNNFDKNIVSTVGTIAEMSGHSAEIHEKFYSSSINKERFFDTYHHNLGEVSTFVTDDSNVEIGLAHPKDVIHCLKVLFGTNAKFLSDLQRDFVIDACNNTRKHTFCSIGCGGGKSLGWIIPPMREDAAGFGTKLRIIVIPYCFLLDHHVNSTIKVIGECSGITVEKLKGVDIHNNILPNILRDTDNLPGLLFLSLEAMSGLVTHHFTYLQQLGEHGLLKKIYIDECHTILSELNFRARYHSISKLAGLNVPMVLFTGTIQRSFIADYMGYMFNSKDTGMYQMFIDNNIFGDKILKLEHNASKNYVKECCDHVIRFTSKYKSANVHVIVSTVEEGKDIHEQLCSKLEYECCNFIFSGSDNQDCIAKKWNENRLQILISTTVGLVGNESSKTQMVCIVGLLYNIPSIIQSMGRIRPRKRTSHSLCSIFTSDNNQWKIKESKDSSKAAFNELVGCKIISKDSMVRYFQSMTMASVHNWLFDDEGCRLVSLGKRMGYNVDNKCNICDKCITGSSNVRMASLSKRKQNDIAMVKKEAGIRLLQRLKQKCICCNTSTCSGTCVVKSIQGRMVCYHCLGYHTSSSCGVYKSILQGKACYSCYVFNYDQTAQHSFESCRKEGEIRERLRALIHYDYREKTKFRKSGSQLYSFNVHLSGIYASEETFFTFLYEYRDWK